MKISVICYSENSGLDGLCKIVAMKVFRYTNDFILYTVNFKLLADGIFPGNFFDQGLIYDDGLFVASFVIIEKPPCFQGYSHRFKIARINGQLIHFILAIREVKNRGSTAFADVVCSA